MAEERSLVLHRFSRSKTVMKVGDLVLFCGNPYFGVIIEQYGIEFLVHWFNDNYQSWEKSARLKEYK